MQTFVTLFPFTTNHNLTKEVGLIPYYLSQHFGYNAKIVSYKCDPELFKKKGLTEFINTIDATFPAIKPTGEINGLPIEFIKSGRRIFGYELSTINYILNESKKINILNLYHLNDSTYLLGYLYKKLNPNGILYIKSDINPNIVKLELIKSRRHLVKHFISKQFFKQVDILSVESKQGLSLVLKSQLLPPDKCFVLPNGVNNCYLEKELSINNWQQKENIILFVGRFGSPDKNTELIIKYIKKHGIPKYWKFVLAGPIFPSIQNEIKHILKVNKNLEKQLLILGNITNRIELYELYNRSRVFCLPSRKEGFPVSVVEALYFGNYCLLSDGIATANDILEDISIGVTFKSNCLEDFKVKLELVTTSTKMLEDTFTKRLTFAESNFYYSKIIKNLDRHLKQCNNQK